MVELITLEELEKEIKAKEGEIRKIQDEYGIGVINNNTIISSRQVAEILGKRHDNVLQKIRELIKKNKQSDNLKISNALVWKGVEYIDKKGQPRPEFIMGLRGFTILVSSYKTTDNTYYYMVLYTGVFEDMGKALTELIELNYKKDKLLLEQQKHYIYSAEQEDYCVITGICGYSNNYLYQAVIDYNNKDKAKIVKTKGYNGWASLFKEKAHDKLISYVKEKNIDLTKDIYVTLLMQYPKKFDLINFEKGLCDQITLILKDIEPTFDDKQIKTLLMNGINDSVGYDDSIIAIRIQN